MKVKLIATAMLAIAASASAQSIYELESYSNNDLNGTARYVGMGGAMNALGADLSTMSSNPAGIGLYRSSDVAGTVSIATQDGATKYYGKSKTHVSFDNLGFVYSMNADAGATKFVNIGFNYRKHKDFNTLISSAMNMPKLSDGRQASQTWQMVDLHEYWGGASSSTPMTNMGYETYLYDYDSNTKESSVFDANSYLYKQAQWGSIQDYSVSLGFNFNEQFYLGFALGLYNVDYNSYSQYGESLNSTSSTTAGEYVLQNKDDISGTGVDFKMGLIVRPIEENPFRIGFSFTTPTYYSLRRTNTSKIVAVYESDPNNPSSYGYNLDYKYNIYTPWKFNFSLGTTFMNQLAIGAEYEYSDYSSAKVTYDNGYDAWGYSRDETDEAIKDQADRYLKGVSTFKIGLEWYVDPKLAIRLGYNYVSSPVAKSAFRNQFINSASLDYATSTAYMNPSDINRITAGLGTNFGKFYVDLSYMYQNQHGDFYAFNTQNGNENRVNECPSSRIKLNRSKVMLTLGYRF